MDNVRLKHPTIGLAAMLLLVGCGRESSTPPVAASHPEAEAASTNAEQPSPSAQSLSRAGMIEQQLVDLGAKQTDRGLLVTLPSATFRPGQTSFEPELTTRLEQVVELLRARPELQARVIGYTDSRGSEALNERLSRERAAGVQQALERERIDAARITVQGAGESNPVADNDTATGRAQNRRVEILVTDRTGRYASSGVGSPSG